jgi:hypothetical protein
MTDKTYNGWTNWETWQILLWCDSEPGTYEWRMEWLRGFRWEPDSRDVEMLFRDMFPEGTPDMDDASDMAKVDWDEITEHLVTEWQEENAA